MPAGDAQKIRFAPDGAIYLAPTGGGLVLPTDVGDGATPPTGYKALGYVSDAGVTITPAIQTTPLNAWQSAAPVLYNVDSASFQLSATLIEANKLVTENFFGATWTEVMDQSSQPTGDYRLDLSTTPDLQEFSVVVDWKYKTNLWRAVVGRAMVTERGAITLQRTQNQSYELTINAMDNSGSLGYILTNESMTA
ncbi:hypothetical protein [Streptomyces sp. NBC_01500]|uniref:phage tail tube protein n=1 Tax=Streptomyces sp. NBC_01500 TaxID=2903886 RepID=UPI00225A7283|nr:hypothetical protein [Streptomyces sp. NBC_01500]MCX4554135.1 hypothetical protein [Streptomyces sp. NBC_01500]